MELKYKKKLKEQKKPYLIMLAALGIKVLERGARLIVPKIPAFRNLRDIEYQRSKVLVRVQKNLYLLG